ncbi:unnamed protein product, partial [Protopolystoma xenopodis]
MSYLQHHDYQSRLVPRLVWCPFRVCPLVEARASGVTVGQHVSRRGKSEATDKAILNLPGNRQRKGLFFQVDMSELLYVGCEDGGPRTPTPGLGGCRRFIERLRWVAA